MNGNAMRADDEAPFRKSILGAVLTAVAAIASQTRCLWKNGSKLV